MIFLSISNVAEKKAEEVLLFVQNQWWPRMNSPSFGLACGIRMDVVPRARKAALLKITEFHHADTFGDESDQAKIVIWFLKRLTKKLRMKINFEHPTKGLISIG
jgi:hypothetical protein